MTAIPSESLSQYDTGSLLDQARIARIRTRYQTGDAWISVERARYFTEAWDRLGDSTPPQIRTAEAMKHVYANVTQYLDPDDRIAGTLTEHFLGIPIDIERGVFNTVLATELQRRTILAARIKGSLKGLRYMLKKRQLGQFIRDRKLTGGATALELGLDTIRERPVNRFQLSPADQKELLGTLLPRWKGRTLSDRLESRTLESGLCSKEMIEFAMAVPGNTSRQVQMISTAATIATIQGHVILDYRHVLEKGLRGIRAEIEARSSDTRLNSTQIDYLTSARTALDGIEIYARRLADHVQNESSRTADPEQRAILGQMADVCRHVPFEPATSLREAIQSIWTIKTAVELAHPVNLHCFGRLDQDLYPYYRDDLAAGILSHADAVILIEELLLKIMAQNIRPESNLLGRFYHRFFGSSPITLGGVDRQGRDGTNPLTYVFVEAAERSRAVTNISVRIADTTPPELMEQIGAALYRGSSNFSVFNDATHIPAMARNGFAPEDARDYAIMGCVEATCPGKTGSMSASALLLSRMLDITLRNGDARTLAGLIQGEGDPSLRRSGGYDSFDELLEAFVAQGRYFIAKIVRVSDLRDQLYAETMPAPLISLFMDGCLDKAADVTQGGGRYDLTGISMINSIANVTDSLLTIKKLVFEARTRTLAEIMEAIDHNFVGYEELLTEIKNIKGKWGNGAAESDALAAYILGELAAETRKHRSWKGGAVVPYLISMTTHTIDGRLSIASADGRRAATPYAASGNPYNVDKSGVTAVLRSVAALPHAEVLGCAVNVKFHPSAIGHTPAARRKWSDLINSYFKLGGGQLQPSIASSEMLRAAQANPEQHRDLIVKVGGYSTYFVDLGQEIQDEIIARTEHG